MTQEQQLASDPAASVWVSANAGTGKTKVLCDRVLRLLLGGSPPERILCLTYTKAAAAEMQERIQQILGKWALADNITLEQSLTQLLGSKPTRVVQARARRLFALVLDSAEGVRIQTLHAFCQSLLRRFPLEAGIAPHFTVIEQRTVQELLSEARQQLFTQSTRAEAIADALAFIHARLQEDGLKNYFSLLVKHRLDWNDSKNKLRELVQLLGLPAKALESDEEELKLLREAIPLLLESGVNDQKMTRGLVAYAEGQRSDAVMRDFCGSFLTKVEKAPRKLVQNKALREKHPFIVPLLESLQQKAIRYFEMQCAESLELASRHSCVLAAALQEIYATLKAQRGFMDYDDLVESARRLLYTPGIAEWVLFKLDGGIDHLLVDEAQDTSPALWDIVKALADEFYAGKGAREVDRTLFVVGDEKQSIYSFQGARPRAFQAMRNIFSSAAEDAGFTFHDITLARSFRSTEAVLKTVDAVFASDAIRSHVTLGEGQVRHETSRGEHAGRVELWPLIEPAEAEQYSAWEMAAGKVAQPASVRLASEIAKTISNWLQEGTLLESKGRPREAGDIMILLRTRGALMGQLVRALKRRNVPVAGVDRLVLTQHIAVMDLMAAADFLLLPEDDLSLAALLKSPLFGISEEQLYKLAYGRGNLSLWARLNEIAHDDAKLAVALGRLKIWLAQVDYLQPFELFTQIIEAEEGRKAFARRLGEEANDPLNEFLELALQYEQNHATSLQGFMHWLRAGETEIKRDMEHGSNAVRIMTVHASKGLQAPIVFLPDTISISDKIEMFLEDKEKQQLLWPKGLGRKHPWPTTLKEKIKEEQLAEYYRLLYVAMTRAEDELIVCGAAYKKKASEGNWYEVISDGFTPMAKPETRMLDGREVNVLVYSTPQKVKIPSVNKLAGSDIPPLPDYVNRPPPAEPLLPRPLSPSRLGLVQENPGPLETNGKRMLRGKLLHRLLEYIPSLAVEKHEAAIKAYLARYGTEFSETERMGMQQELLKLINAPELKEIFSGNALAEVSISGVVERNGEQVVYSGQIDRLLVKDNKVLALDYKTNRNVPASAEEVPKAYYEQMEAYRTLLREIYKGKEIECALIFTAAPSYMILPPIP